MRDRLKHIFNPIYACIQQHKYSYLTLLLLFITGHVHFYGLGGHFEDGEFGFWQLLDLELLRTRLLESLWYLHMQPPLFNFFVGIVEKCSFGYSVYVYPVVYVCFGLVSGIALFHLLLRFRIHKSIALLVTSVCLLSPSWMLYEHWLMYTFPVMMLLTLTAWQMHKYVSYQTIRNGAILFSLMVVLAYTRSIFHILWFLFTLVILFAYFRGRRKRLLITGFVPLILIFALYAKNAYLFGQWTTSTWLGPNLHMMCATIPSSVKRELILKGKLSGQVYIQPFQRVGLYANFVKRKEWGIPALDQKNRGEEWVNHNHGWFVEVNRQYQEGAIAMILASPGDYFTLMKQSWRRYNHPAWNYDFFHTQPAVYFEYPLLLNKIFFGWEHQNLMEAAHHTKLRPEGTFLCWLLPLLFFSWIVIMFLPQHLTQFTTADRATLSYCMFTIVLITFAAITIVRFENFRLRFTLTPYFALLFAITIDRVVLWIAAQKIVRKRVIPD